MIEVLQSEGDFAFNYSNSQTLMSDDFATASGQGSYNGTAGDDADPQIVLYEDLSLDEYQLIYDPDGNQSGQGEILAHFDTDPGITKEAIYVEVTSAG